MNLSARGIQLSHTAAKAHEQNGIVERNVRTVTEKMRALRLQSNLDNKFWLLLLDATIDLLNSTANKVTGVSSFQAVHGKAPDIAKFKPFGCRALWHDPKENKLEAKASEGIYVGRCGGGFLILNPVTKRTITRRDVRFHDMSFPLAEKSILVLSTSPRRAVLDALNGLRADDWRQAFN